MELEHQEISNRVKLVFEMLEASHGLISWIYDGQGECLQTSCDNMVLDTILTHGSGKTDLLAHGNASDTPLLLTMPLGLVWVVAFERCDSLVHRAYILGPAFHTEISMRGIVNAIEEYRIPQYWKLGFMDLMKRLPVCPTRASGGPR